MWEIGGLANTSNAEHHTGVQDKPGTSPDEVSHCMPAAIREDTLSGLQVSVVKSSLCAVSPTDVQIPNTSL